MIKLHCLHVDTCLPDYWGGHHLPHIAVPVDRETTIETLRDSLMGEIWQGAIMGSDPRTFDDAEEYEEMLDAMRNAIKEDVHLRDKRMRYPFPDLEKETEETDCSVMAYFVFTED